MHIAEAVELTQLAFDLADRWRNPVLIYGDYLLAHTCEAVEIEPLAFEELPRKDWAVDGSLGGSGRSRLINSIGMLKGQGEIDPERFWKRIQAKHDEIARSEVRFDAGHLDDAELVVVAFGTAARFVRYAVRQLRARGARVGWIRPITLWPFPYDAVAQAAERAAQLAVFEQNAGQMIDDVRLGVLGRAPVSAIGGISTDTSGFGVGSLLDADVVVRRIEALLERGPEASPGREQRR
jgi:2-oxoglutarate ferredoxin oxidoreductase subunit alpha